MLPWLLRLSVIAFLVGSGVLKANAQASDWKLDRSKELLDRYREAIVKVTVSGRNPENTDVNPIEGTGFIVYSGDFTLIVTAAHLIGSNAKRQPANVNWLVENGTIKRRIQVESIDSLGRLVMMNRNANVVQSGIPEGIDVILLVVPQGPFKIVDLPEQSVRIGKKYNVMLLGIPLGRDDINPHFPIGIGSLSAAGDFVIDKPSKEGESGGPWIDLSSGKVLAVASGAERADYVGASISAVLANIRNAIPQRKAPSSGDPRETSRRSGSGKCSEVLFTDYSRMPPVYSTKIECDRSKEE